MSTRLFATAGGIDVSLCKRHQQARMARGEYLGVPGAAMAIMLGLKPFPTGAEPCADCEQEAAK